MGARVNGYLVADAQHPYPLVGKSYRVNGLRGFSPTQLSGCVLHLRADMGITLNGSTVSAWANQGTAGGSATQGTGSAQPTFTASGFGTASRPYLKFDGGDQLVETALSLTAASARTILIVAKRDTAGGGAIFSFRRSSRYLAALCLISGGVSYISGNGVDAGSNVTVTAGTLASTSSAFRMRQSYTGSGDAPTASLNGAALTVTAGTQGNETGTAGYLIGNNPAGAPWTGAIAEIIAYDRALTAAELAVLDAYQKTFFGLP